MHGHILAYHRPVRIERPLPGTPRQIWDALNAPDQLCAWLLEMHVEQRADVANGAGLVLIEQCEPPTLLALAYGHFTADLVGTCFQPVTHLRCEICPDGENSILMLSCSAAGPILWRYRKLQRARTNRPSALAPYHIGPAPN